jgi:hypothetical protein
VICATSAFSYASELESNATDTGKVSEAGAAFLGMPRMTRQDHLPVKTHQRLLKCDCGPKLRLNRI